MEVAGIIALFLAIGVGLAFSLYFLKRRKFWGIPLGILLSLMGIVPLVVEYNSVSGPWINVFWIAAVFTSVVLLYPLSEKNLRMLLLLPFPLLLVLQVYLYSLPLIEVLSVYLVFVGVVICSYDFSRVDITSRMRRNNRYLKRLLWPFSLVQRFVTRVSRGRPTPARLAVGYLMFQSAVLIAVPLLIAVFLREVLTVERLMIAVLGYLYASRLAAARGNKTMENASLPA